MSSLVDPVFVLRRAANIVSLLGWTQGAPARSTSGIPVPAKSGWARRWCASGAIVAAGNPGFVLVRGQTVACPVEWSIWNDQPGRTAREVADRLRAVADQVDRGGAS